jgi:MoaA/NifB/PqqE/SkfB family radical SAM enzyme
MSDSPGPDALPRYIVLELTWRCNNRCLYCYGAGGQAAGSREPARDEMTTDEIRAAILKLKKELPVDTIGISGGEPLLRDDLPEILSFIADQGISPVLITNGTLLTKDKVEKTRGSAEAYQITLLSHRREIHDRLAGREGAWDAVLEAMLRVRDAGGYLAAVFIATKLNYRDLVQTAELAVVLGARAIMYNRLNLSAHNIQFSDLLLPTPEMIIENLESLEELGERYGIPSAASVVLEPCVIPLRDYRHVEIGWCPLGGEGSYLTIDPGGNIRICNHSPVVFGNIRTDSIRDLFLHHPYLERFRTSMPGECRSCRPDL